MKVYIASFYEDYEGEIVIGVCATRELAEKVIEKDIFDHWDDCLERGKIRERTLLLRKLT